MTLLYHTSLQDQDNADDKINEATRECIKRYIIDLMLESGEAIQKQLSDAVSIIGKYDFPEKWSGLLEQMIQKFSTGLLSLLNFINSNIELLIRGHIFRQFFHHKWGSTYGAFVI